MTTVAQTQPSVNGQSEPQRSGRPPGLPVAPRRRASTIWIVAGLLLMLASGFVALLLGRSLSARTDVLVTSRDLATGEVIVEGDLTTASVALDAGVRALDPSLAGDFIGMLVRSPLPQGSLVHEQSFQPSTGNSADTVVFGAALEAGEYPRVGLRPGDIVGMIEVSSSNSTGETLRPAGDLGEAEVVEVVRISGGTSLLISMRVPEEQKILVSQIAEERRLRLVLIEQIADTGTIEPLEPLTPADPLGAAELDDASEEAEADGS